MSYTVTSEVLVTLRGYDGGYEFISACLDGTTPTAMIGATLDAALATVPLTTDGSTTPASARVPDDS
ncbi:MAG: hypothetical protein GEV07_05355 [Streptosporangiales bacterium]|nr:hypothetical protein [Streptosporangiales bacterium]